MAACSRPSRGSPPSRCRHEPLRPEPHSSPRGSGLDREENVPERSRSRPLPQHRRPFPGTLCNAMQSSLASGCRHESLRPEPHSSTRGSGLDREENAPARSRSRPLPQHRRPFSGALFNAMQGSPASGCRHESLHPEPHSSARGSGLGHEENAPARSRSRPLPQHRRLFLEPCSLPCRAHQPAGADMSPCTPNRTPPLVGAVLTAKRMHRHVRGRDRSHGTGDFFWVPVQHHAGLTSQRVPT